MQLKPILLANLKDIFWDNGSRQKPNNLPPNKIFTKTLKRHKITWDNLLVGHIQIEGEYNYCQYDGKYYFLRKVSNLDNSRKIWNYVVIRDCWMWFLIKNHTVKGTLVKTNDDKLLISKLEFTRPSIDFPSGIIEMPIHKQCDPCGGSGLNLEISTAEIEDYTCLVHTPELVKDFLRTIHASNHVGFQIVDRFTPTIISMLWLKKIDHWSKEIIEGAQNFFKAHNGFIRLKQVSDMAGKGMTGLETRIVGSRNMPQEKLEEVPEEGQPDREAIIKRNHDKTIKNRVFEDKKIYALSVTSSDEKTHIDPILGGTESQYDMVHELDLSNLTSVKWIDLDGRPHIPNRFVMELHGKVPEKTSSEYNQTYGWKYFKPMVLGVPQTLFLGTDQKLNNGGDKWEPTQYKTKYITNITEYHTDATNRYVNDPSGKRTWESGFVIGKFSTKFIMDHIKHKYFVYEGFISPKFTGGIDISKYQAILRDDLDVYSLINIDSIENQYWGWKKHGQGNWSESESKNQKLLLHNMGLAGLDLYSQTHFFTNYYMKDRVLLTNSNIDEGTYEWSTGSNSALKSQQKLNEYMSKQTQSRMDWEIEVDWNLGDSTLRLDPFDMVWCGNMYSLRQYSSTSAYNYHKDETPFWTVQNNELNTLAGVFMSEPSHINEQNIKNIDVDGWGCRIFKQYWGNIVLPKENNLVDTYTTESRHGKKININILKKALIDYKALNSPTYKMSSSKKELFEKRILPSLIYQWGIGEVHADNIEVKKNEPEQSTFVWPKDTNGEYVVPVYIGEKLKTARPFGHTEDSAYRKVIINVWFKMGTVNLETNEDETPPVVYWFSIDEAWDAVNGKRGGYTSFLDLYGEWYDDIFIDKLRYIFSDGPPCKTFTGIDVGLTHLSGCKGPSNHQEYTQTYGDYFQLRPTGSDFYLDLFLYETLLLNEKKHDLCLKKVGEDYKYTWFNHAERLDTINVFDLEGTQYYLVMIQKTGGTPVYELIFKNNNNIVKSSTQSMEFINVGHINWRDNNGKWDIIKLINQQNTLVAYGEEFHLRKKLFMDGKNVQFKQCTVQAIQQKRNSDVEVLWIKLETGVESLNTLVHVIKGQGIKTGINAYELEKLKIDVETNRMARSKERRDNDERDRVVQTELIHQWEDYSIKSIVDVGKTYTSFVPKWAKGETGAVFDLIGDAVDTGVDMYKGHRNTSFNETKVAYDLVSRSFDLNLSHKKQEALERLNIMRRTNQYINATSNSGDILEAITLAKGLTELHLRHYYPKGAIYDWLRGHYENYGADIFLTKFELNLQEYPLENGEHKIWQFDRVDELKEIDEPILREVLKEVFINGVLIKEYDYTIVDIIVAKTAPNGVLSGASDNVDGSLGVE